MIDWKYQNTPRLYTEPAESAPVTTLKVSGTSTYTMLDPLNGYTRKVVKVGPPASTPYAAMRSFESLLRADFEKALYDAMEEPVIEKCDALDVLVNRVNAQLVSNGWQRVQVHADHHRKMMRRDDIVLSIGAVVTERGRDDHSEAVSLTPAQRATASAMWSAELRAKVAASRREDAERDRVQVVADYDDDWGRP